MGAGRQLLLVWSVFNIVKQQLVLSTGAHADVAYLCVCMHPATLRAQYCDSAPLHAPQLITGNQLLLYYVLITYVYTRPLLRSAHPCVRAWLRQPGTVQEFELACNPGAEMVCSDAGSMV